MKERVKSVVIVLLFVSLVGLTFLNWFSWGGIGFEAQPDLVDEINQEPLINVTRPLTGDYDRYSIFLGDFLSVADSGKSISVNEWNAAFGGGVRFEFLSAVPVWLLAQGLGSTASDIFDGVWVSEIILYDGGLLTFDGSLYTRFTASLKLVFPEPAESADDDGSNLFQIAAVSGRFSDDTYRSELLDSLGFNPNSNSKYQLPDGEWVFVDDAARTLHLGTDGRVVYHDGARYESTEIDERTAINLCLAALPKGAAFWGDGNLVFNSVTERDGGYDITLDYVLNGAVFIEGQSVFLVRGGVLSEAVIYLTPAQLTDETVRLMPEKSARLLLSQNKKLCIGYRKNEGGQWSPEWYGY